MRFSTWPTQLLADAAKSMINGKHIKVGKVISNRKKCRPKRAKSALERKILSNFLLSVLNHLNMSKNRRFSHLLIY